ncbi:MAG TPA: FCD domain-containing protein [Acidocella sp.]|nr:FCD domain-containing protein [Acidocella sp.]
MLTPIEKFPAYIRVAKAIESEIVEGRLNIGDQLPTEQALAQQLGVHRSTVREGMRALENAALLMRGPGKRLVVSAPPPEMIAEVNTRAIRFMHVTFRDLWEVQMTLEPFAARLAAERADDQLIAALAKNVAALEERLEDDVFIMENDVEFHRLVSEATGNPVMDMAGRPTGGLLLSATKDLYVAVPQARVRLLAAHKAIHAAIAAHDPKRSERWMQRHIMDFKRGYEVGGLDMGAPLSASK